MTRIFALATLALALAACSDDGNAPQGPPPPRGVVVLNGYGSPGVTLLADTGSASTHLELDPFDGSHFWLERDTLLTTSSKGKGDLLFVADVQRSTVVSYQLPAKSNPANARFVDQPGGGRFVAVALRDSNAVALVRASGAGAGSVTMVRDAGVCPTEAFRHGSAMFVVASNQRCTSDYLSFSQAYVVWIPDAAPAARETIVLGNSARGAASVVVLRDTAYIFTIGTTSFGGNIEVPPTVSRVDLRRREYIDGYGIESAVIGSTMRLGADGLLYVSAFAAPDFSIQRVYAIDPSTMLYRGTREANQNYLRLRTSSGATPNCSAATADRLGRVYCVEVGAATLATLYVFDAQGTQVRSAPAGQGAVDIDLRL